MKLSIITVNLNNAEGLRKTAESIVEQTFSEFEWIVIDGGSSDGSVEIIREYYSHLYTWISEADSGIYNAMNKGIMRSSGEYCFFLNSGDFFLDKNSLSDFFSFRFDEDLVSGNMYVGLNGKFTEKCRGKDNLTFVDVYQSVVKHQATFIKKELFSRFGLYDESLRIVADYDFFLKTIGFNDVRYRYFDADLTWFDNSGISNRNMQLVSDEKKIVKARYLPEILQADLDLFIRYRNIRYIDNFAITFFLFRVLGKTARIFCSLVKNR